MSDAINFDPLTSLTCIANLSNDEVFTPPEFANRMLVYSMVKRNAIW